SAVSGRPLEVTQVRTSGLPEIHCSTARCDARSTVLMGTAAESASWCNWSEAADEMGTSTRKTPRVPDASVGGSSQRGSAIGSAPWTFFSQKSRDSEDLTDSCSSAMKSRYMVW